MLHEELIYVMALHKAKGIGDINAKKLIAHFGSAKSVLEEKKNLLEKVPGIGIRTVQSLLDSKNLIKAEKELRYIEKNGIQTHYFLDSNYPESLKQCIDAPVLFFSKGMVNFDQRRSLSVVGTRKMTYYGKEICAKLIEEMVKYDPIIVSGFAYGVDICAHKMAVKNGLQTIAVLAHGFEEIYPKEHKKHIDEILEKGGFISEFWHNDILLKENFIKRNRIVAGISQATVVIESAEKGGSLVTADIANSYSRDVFAIPGRTTDFFSRGCNDLIQQHKASMIANTLDIPKLLNWDASQSKKSQIQKKLFVELLPEEQIIFDFLVDNGKENLDKIALNCDFTIQKTATHLFNMELKGMIIPIPGKYFEAI